MSWSLWTTKMSLPDGFHLIPLRPIAYPSGRGRDCPEHHRYPRRGFRSWYDPELTNGAGAGLGPYPGRRSGLLQHRGPGAPTAKYPAEQGPSFDSEEPGSFFTKSNESITAEWEAPVLDPPPRQVGIVKLFTVELSEIIHFVANAIITLDTSYIKV